MEAPVCFSVYSCSDTPPELRRALHGYKYCTDGFLDWDDCCRVSCFVFFRCEVKRQCGAAPILKQDGQMIAKPFLGFIVHGETPAV